MPVRIARRDLEAVQALITDEGRRWVEQHIPGRSGSVFQELGRSAVRLRLEGLLVGEEALETLEALRHAQSEAQPVPFAADITAGMDLTDVLIDSLQVRQVAGYRNRYWYRLLLREHVEDPPAPATALSEVDAGVETEAASWADGAVDASSAMQDVAALPALAEANPALLEHLSEGDITSALGSAAGTLTGGQLEGIASALGLDQGALGAIADKLKNVQFSDVVAAYNAIKDPSSIPALLANNPGLLDRLGVSDLGRALVDKVDSLTGGQFSDVLKKISEVDPAKVASLIEDLRNADSLGDFVQKLAEGGIDLAEQLTGVDLGTAKALVNAVTGSADFLRKLQQVGQQARALGELVRSFDPLEPVRLLAGQSPDEIAGSTADTGRLVRATGDLVRSLGELLATNTVQAVIDLVREVGAQAQLNAAVDLVDGVLGQVDGLLAGSREPLRQLGGLSGLLTLTSKLVSGLERLSTATGEELNAMGLGAAREATGPLSQALGKGSQVLAGGGRVLDMAPSVEDVEALRADLASVRRRLQVYKLPERVGAV